MSYKDINEKYKKIFEKESKRKQQEYNEELNEILNTEAKEIFDEYKKTRKEIDTLLKSFKIPLQNHQNKFFKSKDPNSGWVDNLKRVRDNLKKDMEYLNAQGW